MTGREAREKLIDYAEGALDPRQTRELEALLAADPGLRREVEELRETLAAIRDARSPAPPAGYPEHFAARLVARMREEGVAFGAPPRLRAWERVAAFVFSLEATQILAAAAIAFFLVLGARVVVHRLDQVPPDVALSSTAPDVASAQDPWTPPDEEIASLSDAEARAIAEAFSAEVEAGVVKDLAKDPEVILPQFPGESAVIGELAEMDNGDRQALYDELGRDLALPL